jgi:hypothetical protein
MAGGRALGGVGLIVACFLASAASSWATAARR